MRGSLGRGLAAAASIQARRDGQLTRLRAAIADYEAEFGEISPEELQVQEQSGRGSALVVRARARVGKSKTKSA